MNFEDAKKSIAEAIRNCLKMELAKKDKNDSPSSANKIERISTLLFEKRDKLVRTEDIQNHELVILNKLLFQGRKPLALLSFDLDKIHDYVFESPKLPQIRGASQLFKNLLDENSSNSIPIKYLEHNALPKGCIVYSAGGGGLLMLPASMAEDFKKMLEEQLSKELHIATITCVIQEVEPIEFIYGWRCTEFWLDTLYESVKNGHAEYLAEQYGLDFEGNFSDKEKWLQENIGCWLAKKHFGEIVTRLGQRLQQRKNAKADKPFYETIPDAARCRSCQIRPAIEIYGRTKDLICEVCRQKHETGKSKEVETDRHVDDLQKLGDASGGRTRGYVGVIYGDGNSMGSIFEKLTTIADYRIWSQLVSDAFDQEKVIVPVLDNNKVKKYENLVFGGDDLLLMVPADKALAVTDELIQTIENKFADSKDFKELVRRNPSLKDTKIGLSAGLVLAHDHFPAKFLIDYAESLLKSAKHKAKQQQPKCSAVDFMILTDGSPLSETPEAIRKEFSTIEIYSESRRKELREVLKYTQRPFTYDEFKKFLYNTVALKEYVSRNQIYAMRELLNESPSVALLNFLYQTARNGRVDKGWRKWIDTVKKGNRKWAFIPQKELWELIWQTEEDDFVKVISTPFADYVEVLDFIDKKQEAEGADEAGYHI